MVARVGPPVIVAGPARVPVEMAAAAAAAAYDGGASMGSGMGGGGGQATVVVYDERRFMVALNSFITTLFCSSLAVSTVNYGRSTSRQRQFRAQVGEDKSALGRVPP
uniref:CASP-like protein n=1 Tax=Plectus sambesii TaxID=2011161 RepID=A0A914WY71_9BILA